MEQELPRRLHWYVERAQWVGLGFCVNWRAKDVHVFLIVWVIGCEWGPEDPWA
jgi:hypothetical protein